MNKVIIFSGDSLRHKYIVDKLLSNKFETYWIITKRTKTIKSKKKINIKLKKLLDIHNKKRYLAEKKFFNFSGTLAMKKTKKVFYISKYDDVEKKIFNIFTKIRPNVFLTYGCKKIDIQKIKKKLNQDVTSGIFMQALPLGTEERLLISGLVIC